MSDWCVLRCFSHRHILHVQTYVCARIQSIVTIRQPSSLWTFFSSVYLFFSTPGAFPQSLQQTFCCPRLVPHQVCGSNPRIGKKKCFSVVSCVADLNPCVGKCRYYNTDLIVFSLGTWSRLSLRKPFMSYHCFVPPTSYHILAYTLDMGTVFPQSSCQGKCPLQRVQQTPHHLILLRVGTASEHFKSALPFGDGFRYVSCIF